MTRPEPTPEALASAREFWDYATEKDVRMLANELDAFAAKAVAADRGRIVQSLKAVADMYPDAIPLAELLRARGGKP